MDKRLNTIYGWIHGNYWMGFGIIYSFASTFLLGRGYSNSEIGIIIAAGNVGAVFLQPFLADLSDRSKKIDLISICQLITICLMVLTLGLFIMQRKSMGLLILFIALIAWTISLQPLLNSLSFFISRRGVNINFGICRSVGSLCYAIICSFLGAIVENVGIKILPYAAEISLGVLLISFIVVRNNYNKLGKSKHEKIIEEREDNEDITIAMFVKRNKIFCFMSLGIMGVYISNSILNSFMLQVINGVGGDNKDLGLVLSVMAFLEIPTLFFFDRIRKRFTCQSLLKFASICFVVKIFLIYAANSVAMIYVAHLLQPFAFGIFIPATVMFTDEIMSKGEAVKGQALIVIMKTISAVISGVFGGKILDLQGPKMLLLWGTIAAMVGCVIVYITIGKIRKQD